MHYIIMLAVHDAMNEALFVCWLVLVFGQWKIMIFVSVFFSIKVVDHLHSVFTDELLDVFYVVRFGFNQ